MTIYLQFLALVLGFALWAALGYLGKVPLDPLIALMQMGLGGLITHMLKVSAAAPAVAAPPAATPQSAPSTQGGFASLGFIGLIVVIACGALLAGCTTMTPTQVNQVKLACATDAGVRPSVDLLLAMPGLAKPEEVAAVVAARTIIDQVCKNPDAPFTGAGDPYLLVTQATSTMTGILVQLQMRAHK